MVMTSIERENVEDVNKKPITNVKKKEKQSFQNSKNKFLNKKKDMEKKPIYPSHFYETKEKNKQSIKHRHSKRLKEKNYFVPIHHIGVQLVQIVLQ